MANTDIKGLIDSIIDDTNNSYPSKGEYNSITNSERPPVTFDKGEYRNKLSMFVLKDVINGMMHDDTANADELIDKAIDKHMKCGYGGSCYNYLTQARDAVNSPMISDIIQEIDNETDKVAEKISKTKDASHADNTTDAKDLLKNVENYDEFREKIKTQVSEQVVNDVTKVLVDSNDAPLFDDLDKKLAEKKTTQSDTVTNESVILRMTGVIVSESAIAGEKITTDEGIEMAIVEYCMFQMDRLFKQHPVNASYKNYMK